MLGILRGLLNHLYVIRSPTARQHRAGAPRPRARDASALLLQRTPVLKLAGLGIGRHRQSCHDFRSSQALWLVVCERRRQATPGKIHSSLARGSLRSRSEGRAHHIFSSDFVLLSLRHTMHTRLWGIGSGRFHDHADCRSQPCGCFSETRSSVTSSCRARFRAASTVWRFCCI